MRLTERICGALAGVLGLAALIVTVTQQAVIKHNGSAVLVMRSAAVTVERLAIAIPVALATLGALLVALGAVLWTRAATRRGAARGVWTALVVFGAVVCVLGVYVLGASSVWVNIGGSPSNPLGVASVSAAFLFAPAAMTGIVAAVVGGIGAARPRGHAPALS